jgi:hypothetical protein
MADDDKREQMAKDFEAAFEQVWLGRFPRIDERDLRQRLFIARGAALGPTDRDLSDDDIDDAEAIATALAEYVTLVRHIKAGLRTGELPQMIAEQLDANEKLS